MIVLNLVAAEKLGGVELAFLPLADVERGHDGKHTRAFLAAETSIDLMRPLAMAAPTGYP